MIQPFWRIYTVSAFAYTNPFSGETDSSATAALFHPPRAITVGEGTLAANAPGSGKTIRWLCFSNFTTPAQSGSPVIVSNTETSNRTTTGATMIAGTSDEEGSANWIRWYPESSPAQTEDMIAFGYQDSANSAIGYHGWGSYSDNIMSGKTIATDYYTTFGIGGTATLTATKADVTTVWPLSGGFQYCSVVYTTAGGAATLAFQIDGTDSALTFALPGSVANKTLTTDLTTNVPITAGQTVNWRVNQATSVGLSCAVIIGFVST